MDIVCGEKKSGIQWIHVMPMLLVTAIIFSTFICIPSAQAEYCYVKPRAEIPLRSGKGREYRILEVIPDGTRLEMLEDDGTWAMVRTSNGKQGWMLSRYLSTSPPLNNLVASLKKKQARMEKKTIETDKKLEEASETYNRIKQDLDACVLNRDQVTKDYEMLKQDAADVINLKQSLSDTARELQEVKQKLTSAAQENEHLKRNNKITWFLAGAGVLVVGWIAGLISGRGRKRKSLIL